MQHSGGHFRGRQVNNEELEMNDRQKGYGHPPARSRFRKGQSGNPRGRPRKARTIDRNADADILKRLDSELVEFQGRKITMREAELRILYAKALKGDVRASTLLDRKRSSAGVDVEKSRGGVLVVPSTMSMEEWKEKALIQQAQYRDSTRDDS